MIDAIKQLEVMLKHFTVLELGYDAESPMIGTIVNVLNTKQGIQSFKERVIKALKEHFDIEQVEYLQEFPDMFNGTPYEDIMIKCFDSEWEIETIQQIRILETWIF